MGDAGTVSLRDDQGARRKRGAEPCLVLVLNAARPLDPPLCVPLGEIDEVSLGRGAALKVAEAGPRRLRIDLADVAASSTHARLAREGGEWVVADEQSKNGTLINGRRVERAGLGADDLLELGNSFFLMRRDAAVVDEGPPALRTLNARLAEEFRLLARVARANVPILLQGETGTGKELLALAAHELSDRRGPFVAVNCGGIPTTLVESELFGARRGAYSGADADRLGRVAAANNGTLFLDEIAELPETSQAALLRVLQGGEIVALGATRSTHVDVRVVAATHEDLRERVAAGRFRNDLFARLRGHEVVLPPLRERREDLGLLCAALLARAAGPRAAGLVLARAVARALLCHDWPHNIRELEQVLTRALALVDGNEIRLEHLPAALAARSGAGGAEPAEEARARLVRLVRVHGGNISAIARALVTSRSQVKRLLARHDIATPAAAGDDDD